ncbi:hypothetical protein PSA5_06985 [Pseudomonas syringae pv. actinidiae]|nr:hypothetical protein PSA5_06985 [Pseudomonas syringae pv. actinidiae]
MLDQCAEVCIAALRAVIGGQGDDVARYVAEPVTHLLFHAGLLPTTGSECNLFSLSQYSTPLLRECRRSPHDADVSIDQMGMIFVVDAAGVGKDLALNLLPNVISWLQSHENVGLIRQLQQAGRRTWPIHADFQSG